MKVFIWTVFLGLAGCSNHSGEKSLKDKINGDHSQTTNQLINSATTDSLAKQTDELTEIYTKAITEFIKIVYKIDNKTFDTLYFGKHVVGQPDDFPDIELPKKIESTQIVIVSPKLGEKLQVENKNRVYINLFGFVEKEKAEFIFVIFTNGFAHQYDYILTFTSNLPTNKFNLDKVEFDNYLQPNGQKSNRTIIYKDGHFVREE